jgi:hypothetical protein
MMTFGFLFFIKTFCSTFIVFFWGPRVRKFAKNKNAALQNIKKTWKNIRSGNQSLGGGYCLYMAKPLGACRCTCHAGTLSGDPLETGYVILKDLVHFV